MYSLVLDLDTVDGHEQRYRHSDTRDQYYDEPLMKSSNQYGRVLTYVSLVNYGSSAAIVALLSSPTSAAAPDMSHVVPEPSHVEPTLPPGSLVRPSTPAVYFPADDPKSVTMLVPVRRPRYGEEPRFG